MINEHFKVSSSQDERFTRNYKEIECSPVAGRWEPGNVRGGDAAFSLFD